MLKAIQILQIDATILAGILILLTIVSFDEEISLEASLIEIDKQISDFKNRIESLNVNLGKIGIEKNKLQEDAQKINQEQLLLNQSKNTIDEEIEKIENSIKDIEYDIKFWGTSRSTLFDSTKEELEQNRIKEQQKLESLNNQQNELEEQIIMSQQKLDNKISQYLEKRNDELRIEDNLSFVTYDLDSAVLEKIQIQSEIDRRTLEESLSALKSPKLQVYILGIGFSLSAFFTVIASIFEDKEQRKKWYAGLMGASYSSILGGFVWFIVILVNIGIS